MQDLIKRLAELYGPAGSEERVAVYIQESIRPVVHEVYTDPMGSVVAVKRGAADGKKIMLAAHMDEIGVMVTDIDEKGFLRFSNIGGISPFTLIGQRAEFADGTIGVFGFEKVDDMRDLKLNKMYIDIGASSKEEAAAKVNIGDSAVIHRECIVQGRRVIGKAMDNRIGCAVLIETARRLQDSPNEVYFVFTTQEEVGLRGARTAAYSVDPDYGIAVDVTATGDTPEAQRMAVSLGKGAAIKVKDNSVITHPVVRNLLIDTAKAKGIAYQMEVLEWGGTDAGSIHLTRSGVPTGAVSVPCRYVHTPSEMVDLDDVEACVQLLTAVLERPWQ
ncbi:MAG TPA: M42 family metallopeptidase [Firmicutes bacterium]|nr:M42 family metallopeptidase [Bacillota bacterium]